MFVSGVTFQTIKPPGELGEHVDMNVTEFIGDVVKLDMAGNKFNELMEHLVKVHPTEYPKFEVQGITLDFSNYDYRSLETVVKAARGAWSSYITLCAC